MGRPAIGLVNGTLYLSFASHGDNGPYYGWILGYRASDLALTTAFVTCPTFKNIAGNRADFRAQAGIWMSGGRISSDAQGNLYVTTGNGIFDTSVSNFDANGFPIDHDYGDCILKLAPDPTSNPSNQNGNGWGLKVVDYFTPSNVVRLNQIDADMGSGGVLLLPDNAGNIPGHPHLLITGGKEGRIYLVDRDNMGKYNTAYNGQATGTDPRAFDRVVGEIPPSSGTNSQNNQYYTTGSYFNNQYFIALAKKVGQTWNVSALNAGAIPPGNGFNPAPLQTTSGNINSFGDRGASFVMSANGSSNGVVWAIANRNATNGSGTAIPDALVAFDASNFTAPIFNSGGGSNSLIASGGGTTGVKFSVPTVANGMVYCGTGGISSTNAAVGLGSIVAYGLTNFTPPPVAPGAPDLATASDSGASNSDNITNVNTPTFFGMATPLSTVSLLVDGKVVGNTTAGADAGGWGITLSSPLSDGVHAVTVTATTINGASVPSAPLNVTIDTAPPALQSVAFNFDTPPVQTLPFTFSEDVTASIDVGDLTLTNSTQNFTVTTDKLAVSLDGANRRAIWSFPGYFNGFLPDGNYTATIAAASVSDLAGNPLAAPITFNFFFLDADANHDKVVDTLDFNALAANFGGSGKTFSQGDFNYDGIVDTLDFNALAGNFGKSLPESALASGHSVAPPARVLLARAPFSSTPVDHFAPKQDDSALVDVISAPIE
jgi:hypothetical protein